MTETPTFPRSEEASMALRQWSGAANMSSPGHPLDERRWRRFVATAHLKREQSQAAPLRAAMRALGWPQTYADDYAAEYEHSRELLTDYDAFAAGLEPR